MDRDHAMGYVQKLLRGMLDKGSSDLFITAEAAPSVKVNGEMVALTPNILSEMNARMLVRSIMNDYQLQQFESQMECNFSINLPVLAYTFSVSDNQRRAIVLASVIRL